jgi:hypothetical protein
MAVLAAGLTACSNTPSRATGPTESATQLSLTCSDSAGQQGRSGETVVGGVEGLVLPGSDDPTGLYPIRASAGQRYYIYKAFLAVAPAAAPYATVSVVRPAGARLVYGSLARDDVSSAAGGQALIAASRANVRLPVCGSRFTGFAGGIIVAGPGCVTFKVSSPSAPAATVSVPIGPGKCAIGLSARP